MDTLAPSGWQRWLNHARAAARTALAEAPRPAHPLPVADLRRAQAFYGSVLGFRCLVQLPHCAALMRHAGVDVLLLAPLTDPHPSGTGSPGAPPAFAPAVHRLRVKAMMHWLPALEQRMQQASWPPSTLTLQPWDALELSLQDSEGNTLVWVERLEEMGD